MNGVETTFFRRDEVILIKTVKSNLRFDVYSTSAYIHVQKHSHSVSRTRAIASISKTGGIGDGTRMNKGLGIG